MFNKADFVRRLSGDEELAMEIITAFVNQNRQRLVSLNLKIDEEDAVGVRELAHAIKGSSMNISAGALAKAAGLMEQAGKDGNVTVCRDLGPQVQREFERLCLELGLGLE